MILNYNSQLINPLFDLSNKNDTIEGFKLNNNFLIN